MILLVVDVQNEITCDRLYRFEDFLSNLRLLIKTAREHAVEVVYVRHDDREDRSIPDPDSEIYHAVSPDAGEKIFVKNVNSPFRESGLRPYLLEKGEKELMLVGLMTDFCMDATVKCGFEHGFTMIIPEYCNSTFSNDYMSSEATYNYYNKMMWPNRYATCIDVSEAVRRICAAGAQ